MGKRVIFEDGCDTFRVDDGCLVHSNCMDEDSTIVDVTNLRDFYTWLGEEIARMDAEEADNG